MTMTLQLLEPSTFPLNCWTKREMSLPFFSQSKELPTFLPSPPLSSLLLSVLIVLVATTWPLPRINSGPAIDRWEAALHKGLT